MDNIPENNGGHGPSPHQPSLGNPLSRIPAPPPPPNAALPSPSQGTLDPEAIRAPAPATPQPQHDLAPAKPELPWPPDGFARELAQFLYHHSYRPVREVAIAGALGLLAGVLGRGCRTPTGKDLSQFFILVARSGIGKESMHEGIGYLVRAVPGGERCVKQKSFASGPALQKELLREPGFLNLHGEFGRSLKAMSNIRNTPMQDLRTVMTQAYGKDFLEGKAYSNVENSLEGVDWPALSFLGETTPGTFLEALTPDMMEDGFLSRFLVISHDGDRPPPNPTIVPALAPWQLAKWHQLVSFSSRYHVSKIPAPILVRLRGDAAERLELFEGDCDRAINATTDEAERQVWNRAHLKAMKIACLLAAADDQTAPVAELKHVVWATTLVKRDIEAFLTRQRSGDIGLSDHTRERKVVAVMKDFLVNGAPASYKVPERIRQEFAVPRMYLMKRCSTLPAFSSHPLGSTKALDNALRSLIDSGYVAEVPAQTVAEKLQFYGKCYRLLQQM